jgi:hypothetical protein
MEGGEVTVFVVGGQRRIHAAVKVLASLVLVGVLAGLTACAGPDTPNPAHAATTAPPAAIAAASPAPSRTVPAAPSSSAPSAVPVTNKPRPPELLGTTWLPALALADGWLRLASGPGRVTFVVRAARTDRLDFLLTPTGTDTAALAQLLGTGRRAGHTFTFVWDYPDEPTLAHLTIVAFGPGGRTEQAPFNIYHD